MRLYLLIAAVCGAFVCAPVLGSWIDFSGTSYASLPQTINYNGGSVALSVSSTVLSGTATFGGFNPGASQGQESSVGGFIMRINGTTGGMNSWQLHLKFNHPQQITIHNIETYTNFEETTVQSDGTWSQVDGSNLLRVGGLGLNTLALSGTNGPAGPFGYGHWATTATDLYVSYLFNGNNGDTAGNGLEIAVPEPTSISIAGMLCAGLMVRSRSYTKSR